MDILFIYELFIQYWWWMVLAYKYTPTLMCFSWISTNTLNNVIILISQQFVTFGYSPKNKILKSGVYLTLR